MVLTVFGDSSSYQIRKIYTGRNSTRAEIALIAPVESQIFLKITDPHLIQGHLPPDAVWLASTAQDNQMKFRRAAPRSIDAPRPLCFDDTTGAMLMTHVSGKPLKRILSHRRPNFVSKMPRLVRLAGEALSAWHSLSNFETWRRRTIASFTDYSVANILLQPNQDSIAIVDFPGLIQQASPHHDLASFLHSLLVVRLHPLTVLTGGIWWDWRKIWFDFLFGYMEGRDDALTPEDFETIRVELCRITDREIANYRRLRSTTRMTAERVWYPLIRYHPALRPGFLASLYQIQSSQERLGAEKSTFSSKRAHSQTVHQPAGLVQKRLRVAFVHSHFTSREGAGRVVLELASRLAAQGHDVLVLSGRQCPEVVGRYRGPVYKEIAGPLPSEISHYVVAPLIVRGLFDALDAFCPDIVVPNVFPSNYWVALYKHRRPKVTFVWFCHEPTTWTYRPRAISGVPARIRWATAILGPSPPYQHLDRWCAQSADSIVTNSQYTAGLVQRYYRCDATVVYPGVDTDEFHPSRDRGSYILVVGKMIPFKNFELAIDAVSLCREELEERKIRLVLAGDGPSRSALRERAALAGIGSLTDFVGHKSDLEIQNLYSHALMTLFTTLSEPFGLVPIESMACGTPVISVDAGGPAETIVNLKTGILAKPSPDAFSDGIRALIRDSTLIENMGAAVLASA